MRYYEMILKMQTENCVACYKEIPGIIEKLDERFRHRKNC